jgi:hypothetical protein
MASSPRSPEESWKAAVSLREDAELAREIADRMPPVTAPRAVSVTDLVSPRRAFWRAIAPVKLEAARQQRLDLGRTIHRRLGVVLASEGALEVRVRREGVVGRIDLLSDVPVEVKTSSSTVGPSSLPDERPEQVEQLGMYCALAGSASGRLITVVAGDPSGGRIQAVDLGFADPESIRAEMGGRLDLLRHAWADRRSTGLPACRWWRRGCEFDEAGVCDCSDADPAAHATILSNVRTISERTDVAARIESRWHTVPEPAEPPTLLRFRDLLYPRRAYFDRTAGAGVPPEPVPPSPLEPPDLYGRVTDAIERGPLGEVARLPPGSDEPAEEVGGFRGAPYLVRTSRSPDRASPQSLLDRQPQYALDLGFRCAATGTATARLILGRERAPGDLDRVQVFEFRFAPVSAFARRWRERFRELQRAFATHAPEEAAACPSWMYPGCPYRSECGCGGSDPRSHR